MRQWQGNRISEQRQQAGEIGVIPAGSLELSTQRSLCAILLHDVQRHMSQHGEVVRSVIGTVSGLVLVHHHVEPPVQAALDVPVRADHRVEPLGRQRRLRA